MAPPTRSRRDFLKALTATSAAAGLVPSLFADESQSIEVPDPPSFPANDQVQFATIGTGIIGFINTQTALDIPGTELVAAADCYDARRARVHEVFGEDIDTTADYREIIERPDIDAVVVCTPDHWHSEIARAAMEAGKAVYCEKPMAHGLDEGRAMVEAQRETGQLLQVGSQYASSIVVDKVRTLVESGTIGTLNMIEARYNRNSSLGAWQYTVPPDVSSEDVAWEQFLGDAPNRDFDPVRFFRWRNYWDYGTGLAGDLFVHLLTIAHYVTGTQGPTRVFSSGGLRHWADGREVPDVQTALFEYPETDTHPSFSMSLQSNLADGSGGGQTLRFVGDEGVISLEGSRVTLSQAPRTAPSVDQVVNGYNSVRTFSEAVQEQVRAELEDDQDPAPPKTMTEDSTFEAPDAYSSRRHHFATFFSALRNDDSVVEDATFGHRAAAPALLCNRSYREGTPYRWDPQAMEVSA